MRRIAYIACLLVSSKACAALAVVQVDKTEAQTDPRAKAATEERLVGGQHVTDTPSMEAGWRRLRLADDREAWVQDSAPRLVEPAPENASSNVSSPPPTSQAAADAPVRSEPAPKPGIVVKDLKHLRTLVEEDGVVHPMARRLESRAMIAGAVMYSGVTAGLGVSVNSLIGANCGSQDGACDRRRKGTFVVGLGLSAAFAIVGMLIAPNEGDFLDVLRTWNARHPDRQFRVDGVLVEGASHQ